MNGASGDCYRSLRRGIPILAATRTSARLVTAARGPRRHFPVRRPRRADVPARCRRARDRPAVYGDVIGRRLLSLHRSGENGLLSMSASRRGSRVADGKIAGSVFTQEALVAILANPDYKYTIVPQ